MLKLLQHRLDFEILPTRNPKTILFLDTSEYFERPEGPELQVTPPGSSKYFLVNIDAGKINSFNSNTLGYTNVLEGDCPLDFQDGIYVFTYKICPYQYLHLTKYHVRTTLLEGLLGEIYALLDLGDCLEKEDTCIKKDLIEIHILIESAKANAHLEHIERANKDFSLAQKKTRRLYEKLTNR